MINEIDKKIIKPDGASIPDYGSLKSEQEKTQDKAVASNIKKAHLAFKISGFVILFLISFEIYIVYRYFDAIINNNSWHVMLTLIIGLNSLIISLLVFNQATWNSKKINYDKAIKEALPLYKLIMNSKSK